MEGTIGEIRIFGGNFAPLNWVFCDGGLLNISEYDAVYSLLGTTFGGNGQTTFGVPDFRGRAALATDGAGRYPLGAMGGSQTATMTTLNMPAHTHGSTAVMQIPASSAAGSQSDPTDGVIASVTGLFSANTPDTFLNAISDTGNLGVAGAGMPFNIEQPFTALNYIICVEGIYPSRP